MRYTLEVHDNLTVEIRPYDVGLIFQRGYEMGQSADTKDYIHQKLEEYQKALITLCGMGEVDRKQLAGYATIEAIISDYTPESIIEKVKEDS